MGEPDPNWQCCLFASVDISGSTAFKAQHSNVGRVHWVSRFENFFREFPEELAKTELKLRENSNIDFDIESMPFWRVWKYVGDEVLLWAQVDRHEETCLHVRALISAVDTYEKEICRGVSGLGLKSTLWLANFPFPNVEVEIEQVSHNGDSMSVRDFLGPGIDLGFRLTKFSDSRRIPISAGLALLITRVSGRTELTGGLKIGYSGRYQLKGVMKDRPYPVFWIDRHKDEQTQEDKLLDRKQRVNEVTASEFLSELFEEEEDRVRPFFVGETDEYWSTIPSTVMTQAKAIESSYVEDQYENSAEQQDPVATDAVKLPEGKIKFPVKLVPRMPKKKATGFPSSSTK